MMSRIKHRGLLTAASGALAIASIAGQAQAQTGLGGGNASAPALEEIIVTAQKREQSIERVPASIQAVTGAAISDYQQVSIKSIAVQVPNLVLTASPSGAIQANIRGFGTSTGNSGFEQSVGLYVDGVYSPRPHSYTGAVFDIDRVEVVKGTQGTLFGKNASVGAISLITKSPENDFGGYLDASYGFTFEEPRFEGAVNAPIGDSVRLRVAGVYGKLNEGWVPNLATGKKEPTSKEYAGRAKLE